MDKDAYKKLLSFEVTIQDYFAGHLNDFTNLNWFTPLQYNTDKNGNYNMVNVSIGGSVENGMSPPSLTNTGQPENSIFEASLTLTVETTIHALDDAGTIEGRNLHQDRIAETRWAMLHGNLNQSDCDEIEIIGWVTQGDTSLALNDKDDLLSELTYSFQVGIKNDAWPIIPE